MKIDVVKVNSYTVFRFSGQFLGNDSAAIAAEFDRNAGASDAGYVFNFKNVDAIDSVCVGSIVTILKKTRRKNPDTVFRLVKSDNARVAKVFAIVHLRDLIEFVDTEAEAAA